MRARGIWLLGLLAGGLLLAHLAERWRRRYRRGPVPAWANAWLDNPLRRWWSPPDEALMWADLAAGQRVLEIGPGPGYFTPHIARQVTSKGAVIALELNPVFLHRALAAADRANFAACVHGVCGNALALPLGDNCVDRVLLITVLGEIPDPVKLFQELHRVLRQGGSVLVVEEWLDVGFSSAEQVLVWSAQADLRLAHRCGRHWRYALQLLKDEN